MNAQTFLENFGYITNALGGIKNLKQLIMASALMGRLSPPNESLPYDINSLLEANRSAYLCKLGKKEKPILFGEPLIDEFQIPSGWTWKRVGELCDLQTGATPSRQKPEYFGGDIRWLVSGDINLGEIYECDGRITQEGLDNSNCKILPENSVLIALNGQGKTRATVAILRVPAACNQSLVAMIPFNDKILLPEYLLLSLKYRYYEIRDITGQNQRRGLNMGLVAELSVPLAPIEEQKRIVAKVNDLMALCDKLEVQQQERERQFPVLSHASHARFAETPTHDNLKAIFDEIENVSTEDLRKTILNIAIHGNIVPHDSNQCSEYNRVHANSPIEGVKCHDLNFPGSWEVVPLVKVAEEIVDCPHSTPKWTDHGKICVRTNQFSPGNLDLSDSRFVSEDTFIERIKRLRPKYNDILYSREGGILGVACRVPPNVDLCLGQRMMLIRAGNRIEPRFLELVLNSPHITETARRQTTGSAAPRINVSTVKTYQIPLPPLVEQRMIIAKVDQLMALVDQLEQQQNKKAEIAEALAQAAVAAITGTQIKEQDKMKAPKTELVTKLQVESKPRPSDKSPLANLIAKHKGELSAKALWQQSGLAIDVFYQQLKTEMANGWISEPEKAVMKEVDVG